MEKWERIVIDEVVTNYWISNYGNVSNRKNQKNSKLLTPWNNKKNGGYLVVTLSINGKRVNRYVHRLVGEYFIDCSKTHLTINHKDGDRNNNQESNLEWVTQHENNRHADCLGLSSARKVKQYLNGVFIQEYVSVREASRELGVVHSSILKVCNNRQKTVKGYVFKYSDLEQKEVC